MDISKARCAECGKPMQIRSVSCPDCGIEMGGEFEIPSLAKLSVEDQVFVAAFVRSHGSIKKMESLFDISYPTVKNRLNAITRRLDAWFDAPTPNSVILEQLSRGEISVEEALERLE